MEIDAETKSYRNIFLGFFGKGIMFLISKKGKPFFYEIEMKGGCLLLLDCQKSSIILCISIFPYFLIPGFYCRN